MIRLAAALALGAQAAAAGPVTQVDPATLAPRLAGLVDFESLPLLPEPGLSYDAPLAAPGLRIGERFVGQSVAGHPHDALAGAPAAPLTLAPATPGQFLATAFHAGFGSNALFPLGPDGFPATSARGEGAVALLFTEDIGAFTLKLHAEYPDPLGTRPPPGTATLSFYARGGDLVDRHVIALDRGVVALGFDAAEQPFAGITFETDDPGGLALDDIRYPLADLTG